MRLIKYYLAKLLKSRLTLNPSSIDEVTARRFNFYTAVIITNGRARWDWDRVLGKQFWYCGHCRKRMYEEREWCIDCGKKEEVLALK